VSDVKAQIAYQKSLITLAQGTVMTGRLSVAQTQYLMLETAVVGLRASGADLSTLQNMVAGIYQQTTDEEAKEAAEGKAGKGPTS
jgi:hypothetical protein